MSQKDEIEKVRELNFTILKKYSDYLIYHPRFITSEMINEVVSCGVDEHHAFHLLLQNALDLNNEEDSIIYNLYVRDHVVKLQNEEYTQNPYYQNIKIKPQKYGNWEFKNEYYQPYELFVYKDIEVDTDLHEIVRLGYFNQEFKFLALLENNNEWMMITPNEIETMKEPIKHAYGNVLCFGLGLGYFPYMVSLKEDVKKITIIERDETVIEMFKKMILPQFSNPDKIDIKCIDAFDYIETTMNEKDYHYAFVDLWHNAYDGAFLYLKIKPLLRKYKNIIIDYWIEESILSRLRWLKFESMDTDNEKNNLYEYLSSENLKKESEK